MLTIWGRNTSSNVMKVLWLCDELSIPYHREEAGGAFGRTTEEFYQAMNPNPTVPTIVDTDGYTLWESNVILRYLCATRGGERLFPADPRARGDVERWVDWQQTSHNPRMSTMFLGLIRTPPEKRDMAAIEAARVQTAGLNDMLERQLDGRDYLAGDFSIADIAKCHQRIVGISLGSEDFAADVGMQSDPEGLFYPKQHTIFAARAAGIMPMGFVGSIADFRDQEAFRNHAGEGFA